MQFYIDSWIFGHKKNQWRLNSTGREYEKVFYDGKTFEEIVAEERKKVDDARKHRVDRWAPSNIFKKKL